MELILSNGFSELTMGEAENANGGGVVESIVDGVVSIYDSWCDMWYNVGKNYYYSKN